MNTQFTLSTNAVHQFFQAFYQTYYQNILEACGGNTEIAKKLTWKVPDLKYDKATYQVFSSKEEAANWLQSYFKKECIALGEYYIEREKSDKEYEEGVKALVELIPNKVYTEFDREFVRSFFAEKKTYKQIKANLLSIFPLLEEPLLELSLNNSPYTNCAISQIKGRAKQIAYKMQKAYH